ncbi:FluG domain-containing protein [Beauveria brongniartii RCEF 3172]|uniref:FluG domain-containing protein n=1 Tax=Beauveria brongniartii RCEF 3172 TaxID=1081107 RepID=A0A168EX70_9HYPO|nr:FluG domain-containing protein [Beauveria brongniartii RCEF 3172]
MTFLHWICEIYLQKRRKRSKKKTVNQYWRDFKMLYRRCNKGEAVNLNHCEEIRKYIDDLLLGLTYYWSRDRSVFPTEDDRLDLPTIMLFQAYTACRLAELVDGTKCRGADDPTLDDSDVEDASDRAADDVVVAGGGESLPGNSGTSNRKMNQKWKPTTTPGYEPEPESGSNAGSSLDDSLDVNLHDSVFDSNKESDDGESDDGGDGDDTSDIKTIFLFRENPLPILCPISHILARAIRDNAVDVDGFTHATLFFSTEIGRAATKVNWKTSMLKTPVFRRSVRSAAGGWEKSSTDPMKYSAYAFYLDRIGSDLGSEDKWTSYCMRRGMKYSAYAFYLDRIGSDLGSEDKWTSYCMRRGNANALLKVAPNPVVD